MTKLKSNLKKGQSVSKPRLFLGTTEQIAKETPLKGIKPPVVLTDVYPGFFAASACKDTKQKWGIVEINIEALLPDSFGPWNSKENWIDSLKQHGVCLYRLHVPVIAIAKVIIYSPLETGSNQFVNDAVSNTNPLKSTPEKHRTFYAFNRGLTQWLACEAVSGEELLGEADPKKATQLNDVLQNRNCLELFYTRTENFHSWWKAEGI